MQIIKQISLLLIMIGISGCSSINSTSMTNLSSAYREVIEQYSNENILLNIVRSSKNMPMSFIDIPSVIGTGSVLTDANISSNMLSVNPSSLPGFFSPDKGTANKAQVGITVNNGFTFTQASLDNAEFTKAFLKNIPLGLLGFKGTQQLLPRAVSYSLMIESIELQTEGNVVRHFQNAPDDPNYKDFQNLLYTLVEAGMTVETILIKVPFGPPLTQDELSKLYLSFAQPLIIGWAPGGVVLDHVENTKPQRFQLSRVIEKTQMCVNKFRAQELFGELLSSASYCKDSPHYQRDQNYESVISSFTKNFPTQKNMTLAITLRSAGNVFNFLGRVVNSQHNEKNPILITLSPKNGVFDPYNKRYYEEQPLFKLYKNANLKNAVASVTYKGDTYQIADEDQSYTKSVLEFMSSLLAVSKIPGSIPPSPAVIVR